MAELYEGRIRGRCEGTIVWMFGTSLNPESQMLEQPFEDGEARCDG